MANYKVIQDVESEDKLIGPLTVKQVFYALIGAAIIFVGWLIGKKTSHYAMIPFIAGALPLLFLAIPLGRDQPNDVWLFARLNFMLRPKKRLWSQTGNSYKPLIIKKGSEEVKANLTDGRTVEEIRTQVRDLSNILDSQSPYIKSEAEAAKSLPFSNPEKNTDDEHEKKHSSLNEHFHKLLRHRKENHKKSIDQKVRQTLRSQSHNLYQTPSEISANQGRSFQTPPPKHLSAKISEIAKSKDLKISTLESMVRATKEKHKRHKK